MPLDFRRFVSFFLPLSLSHTFGKKKKKKNSRAILYRRLLFQFSKQKLKKKLEKKKFKKKKITPFKEAASQYNFIQFTQVLFFHFRRRIRKIIISLKDFFLLQLFLQFCFTIFFLDFSFYTIFIVKKNFHCKNLGNWKQIFPLKN